MSNLSTLPKGDSAWLLRKAIERIIEQVSVLETNIGASTSGNSANTQIIFNDNGTLRGDAGLVYNKTTDTLTAGSAVVTGAATITGDLTVHTSTLKVDTTNHRVIVGHTSGSSAFQVSNAGGAGLEIQPTGVNSAPVILSYNRSGSAYTQLTIDAANYLYNISGSTGMILNSTGLGVGVSPAFKLQVVGTSGLLVDFCGSGVAGLQTLVRLRTATGNTNGLLIQGNVTNDEMYINNFYNAALSFGTNNTERLRIDSSGNVGIGNTPTTAWRAGARALQVGVSKYVSLHEQANGSTNLAFSNYESAANVFSYTTGDAPSRYAQINGAHQWYSAAAGTINTVITFGNAKMTLNSVGNLTLDAGNLIMGTSGKGIDFSAVTGGTGTATANVLNDYEEGTWTASIGGTATYTGNTGTYTKIGNRVYFSLRLSVLVAGTGDDYRILGLPFTTGSGLFAVSVGFFASLKTNAAFLSGYATGNQISMTGTTVSAAAITNAIGVIGNGTDIAISGFYNV